MLFMRRCPGCHQPARTICSRCRAGLHRWPPEGGTVPSPGRAGALGLDGITVAFRYDPTLSRIVLAGKNGGRRDVLVELARWLAADVRGPSGRGQGCAVPFDDAAPFDAVLFDAVTWVPASRSHARRRGYDQGRILASEVARQLQLRHCAVLRRSGRGAQAGRNRAERLDGPHLVARRPCPRRVLLVDDVSTTGASLAVAAAALRAAGADEVHAAVVAAVP